MLPPPPVLPSSSCIPATPLCLFPSCCTHEESQSVSQTGSLQYRWVIALCSPNLLRKQRSAAAAEDVPGGPRVVDDDVLQHDPLPLHFFPHLQHDSSDGWKHGVTDMMLQDKPYPDWGKSARAFWKRGNVRITLFWTVLFTLTSVVVLVITTDWISWDKLNRGFLPSDEVSRAFLASFILVFDLLIVMQDWEFPHFMGDVDVNLPGLHTPHMQFKIPFFQKIFKEEYRIHITGKWFNYGIIFLVLILDLNMWKNQIFYKPHEYGQYIGPGQKIYTVKDSESLKDLNRTRLSWEWRSNHTNPRTNKTYVEGDMFLHSRFIGASLDVKCLAFVPSLIAFVWFGFFIWFFGRFLKNEQGMENQDKTYTRMRRKSPSEHSKDMGITRENTQASVEDPLNDPPMVCIRPDFNEIVYKSSHLTSENLSSHLNEAASATETDQDPVTPKASPTN
ncbi:transmembrane protein 117 isoform X1 [Oryctolagus cuniculus]|uniref:transmembrane protein 117 isoform X1 n=1 Tax=Oryctolagus cuniculus TaxID=9986 RepID=UPI00387A0F94